MRAPRLVISALVEVEFASALGRRVRAGDLSAASARAALAQFHAHQSEGFYRLIPIERSHFDRARRWIETLRTPLRTLDALHLALAADSGSVLITADVRLARAASSLRVRRRLLRA